MASTDSPVNIVTPSEALTQWRTRQPVWLRGLGASVDFSVIVIGATLIGLIFLNVVLHAFARDFPRILDGPLREGRAGGR